jgi:uncharacterized membrane protein required for colicin V production
MPMLIEVGIVAIILGMTYALMSEGLWGAALMFFNSLFAGMIAFNFYEPLAALIANNVPFLENFADSLCLMGIYAGSLLLLRLVTDAIAPAMVRFPSALYLIGGITFGLGASIVTMSIMLLAYQASPVDRKVFGSVDYKTKPPFGQGLDRTWLGFFQFVSGYPFARYGSESRDREFGTAHAFDIHGRWLIDHMAARLHGEESVLGDAPAEAGAAPGGTTPPGGAPAGQQQGQQGRPGPGIPGGPAGAASGLAPTTP